ncbi:MAG TPA: aminotransferase class I/II-fold pyridoxal phosphate-dependent enzyme, partial [Methylophilaceae bacterium]|nr:aminotransferase class I/II-fold pyridoxal phosphate-dependent enzyme [Methylophilaceae bacterium]
EFNFSQQPVFPLASEDSEGRVIYIGNLSKILAPELRVSYVAATSSIVDRLAREVALFDQHNNNAIEMTIAELMRSGEIKRHSLKMTKVYQDRRDHFQQLIDDELWQWVDYQSPQSGLAFWLRFKEAVDIKRMAKKSKEEKIHFAFGKTYSAAGEEVPAMRLGYAHMNEKEMQQGFQRLKHIVVSCLVATIISCCSATELIEMSPMSSGLVKMSHTLED